VLRDRPFALVTALSSVMLLYMPMLSLAVPLWIAQRTDAPTWMASLVFITNTVLVMLFQVAVATRVTDTTRAARTVRLAGFVQLAACAVFAVSGWWTNALASSALLLAAVTVFTCGELLLSSGTWEISFGLAPDDKQGQYQGFFGTGKTVGRTLGPVIMTTVVIGWGTTGWLVLGTAFALAGLAMPLAVRWALRTQRVAAG
jgi:MFS family permease